MRILPLLMLALLPLLARGNQVVYHCYDASDGLSDNRVQHIMQLPDGRMVVTTLGNINLWDGTRFSYIHHRPDKCRELQIYQGGYHVYADSMQRLWVKDYHRLWCFDLRAQEYIAPPDTLADLFVDSNGGLWTVGPDSLLDGRIRLCGELQDLMLAGDSLFLFYADGSVVCHRAGSGEPLYRSAAYGDDEARRYASSSLVKRGPDGCFYQLRCGYSPGVGQCLRFDPRTRRWSSLLKAATLLCTLVVPAPDEVVITSPDGIWHVTPQGSWLQNSIRVDDGTLLSGQFNSIFYDNRGGQWLGSASHGLFYGHPSRHRFGKIVPGESLPEGARQGSQGGLLAHSKGSRWQGTVDGLLIDGQIYYAEEGLSNNYVHSMVEDRQGRVWLGTSYGITCVALGEGGAPSFTAFGEEDGTLHGEYADDGAWLLPTGHIVMRGIEGEATLFHPDSVQWVAPPLSPLLIGLSLHGQKMRPGELLHEAPDGTRQFHLEYGQSRLQLQFSALNYDHPSRTLYRYRTAPGSNWTVVRAAQDGTITLSFVSIAPGRYELQVEATADGRWRGETCRLAWQVATPWWRTGWACTLYVAAVAAIGGGVVWLRLRHRQQLQREELLLLRIRELTLMVQSPRFASAAIAAPMPTEAEEEEEERAEPPTRQDPFVTRAIELVEKNMETPGYNVEQLAADLCVERTTLYKRLSAQLDQTPSLFMRSIRLRAAARLLECGSLGVGEVAERTGFSSSSHLSRHFQAEYGCRPGEYAAQQQKKREKTYSSQDRETE